MRMKPAALIARLMLILSLTVHAALFLAVGRVFPTLYWLAGGWVAWTIRRRVTELGSHGTARLASWTRDLLAAGLLGEHGLILGRVGDDETPTLGQRLRFLLSPSMPSDLAVSLALRPIYRSRWGKQFIRIGKFCHLLTVAPAGKGKSVSVLVPNLLSYRGSVVVCDPKGELWHLTATHRRDRLRHRVFFLNPCRMYKAASDSLNPLDFIDASSPDFLSRCKDLANMLVVRTTGEERDPHWNDAAELVLTAFIAFVAACEPDKRLRNLITVRKLISSPTAYTRAIKAMQQVKGFWGVIAMHGRLLQWFIDRELGSVMTTAQRHTAWMDDPQIMACLSHNHV